jgi:hypothetical protein
MLRSLLSASLLLLPSTALAWPASGDWDPLTVGGNHIQDDAEDQAASPGENAWDIVGNSANPAVQWWLDEEYLYLHLLVNADPSASAYSGSWGVLLETDGDTADFEHSIYLSSYGQVIVVQENSDAGDGPDDSAETNVLTYTTPLTTGLAEVHSVGIAAFGVEHDAYVNLAFPLQDLYDHGVLTENTTFQVCTATSDSSLTESLDSDTSGTSNSAGIGDLPSCLADPISVDGDYDGLTWFVEIDTWGTDPTLADSDFDGLDDGDEVALQDAFGCPDPLDDDSDGDGLLDGEEVYTHGSDPCAVDSDGDKLSDYDEVQLGLDPTTDDSDGDGIGDYAEVNCEQGSGGTPEDRDGDGITDATENNVEAEWQDFDDDGHPNWCDTDADGDGLDDAEEYGEDTDCDDQNDWLDDYDDDECPQDSDTDEPDTDTDADADTDTDTDADTDTDLLCDSGQEYCGGKLTGGGCSSAPGALLLIPALLGGLLLAARRFGRTGIGLGAGLLALTLITHDAHAQGLDAQGFSPSIDGDRLLVLDDAAMTPKGVSQPGGGVLFNYAVNPVVYRLDSGDELSVVDGLGTIDALVFFRLAERLRLGMDLPINPVVSGDGVTGGHLLGDIALDTKLIMLDRKDGLGLSASARVSLPTGSTDAWVGSGGLTARALLGASTDLQLGSNPEALILAVNAGLATGGNNLDEAFDLRWGMNLPFGVGASYAFSEPIWAAAELSGAWVLGNEDQATLPLEALLSLRYRPVDSGLMITLGGGLPMSQGVGTPDLRGIAGVAWVPRAREPRVLAPEPTPRPQAEVIPEGMGRIAVSAQRVDAGGGDPQPVQATVVVLGTISDLDRRHHEVGRPPRTESCRGDGRARLDLPPGEYTVRVVAEGYQPSTHTVTVRPGHQLPLVVELAPTRESKFTAGAQGQVQLLPSRGEVPFKPDSNVLSGQSKDELAALSSWWANHLEGTFVVITGYATEAELSEGAPLHEQRAVAVKQAMTLPPGFTHCITVRQGSCGNPQDPAECHKVTIEVTDLACPDLKPPGPPPARPPRQ